MADIDDDFLRHYQRNKTTVPIESYGGCVNTMARIIADHGTGKYVAIVHNLSTCTTKDSRDFSHPTKGVLAKVNGIFTVSSFLPLFGPLLFFINLLFGHSSV